MRVVLLVLIISSFLNAQMDIFTKFRAGYSWKKDMDKYLYSDAYVNNLLKNKNVTFGYYDDPTNIIICYKKTKTLNIYKYNGHLELDKKFTNILTGKNKGDKWVEGDDKTPIGIYKLKYKIDDNKLSDFYGPLAYPTNYPNLYDKYRGKDGHGIWIHGFPKDNPDRKFDTKGCIALPNKELVKLSKTINYKDSVLIIDTNNLPKTNKQKIATILKDIFKWRYAWKYNDLKTYLSFYDKTIFKKANKYNFHAFADMKKRVFKIQSNINKTLKFRNLKIIPYPSKEKNLYQVSFWEIFKAGDSHFQGQKIIYLKLENNKISIFLES